MKDYVWVNRGDFSTETEVCICSLQCWTLPQMLCVCLTSRCWWDCAATRLPRRSWCVKTTSRCSSLLSPVGVRSTTWCGGRVRPRSSWRFRAMASRSPLSATSTVRVVLLSLWSVSCHTHPVPKHENSGSSSENWLAECLIESWRDCGDFSLTHKDIFESELEMMKGLYNCKLFILNFVPNFHRFLLSEIPKSVTYFHPFDTSSTFLLKAEDPHKLRHG
jgi:hypothetical protein